MVHPPFPVVTENSIRLADRSELSLSYRITVHVRVVLFTELMEHFVNGSPWVDSWAEDTL